MRALVTEEMLLGITAFQRTSSLPAMVFAIGADLGIRAARAAYAQLKPMKGTNHD